MWVASRCWPKVKCVMSVMLSFALPAHVLLVLYEGAHAGQRRVSLHCSSAVSKVVVYVHDAKEY